MFIGFHRLNMSIKYKKVEMNIIFYPITSRVGISDLLVSVCSADPVRGLLLISFPESPAQKNLSLCWPTRSTGGREIRYSMRNIQQPEDIRSPFS